MRTRCPVRHADFMHFENCVYLLESNELDILRLTSKVYLCCVRLTTHQVLCLCGCPLASLSVYIGYTTHWPRNIDL